MIAASNLPLADLVAAGHFRADLLALLGRHQVVLPPLRERAGDIPALTRHFLARIGEQPGLRPLGITDGALQLLGAYDWPGNVRQLQAVLFRAAVFCDGDALTARGLPPAQPACSARSRTRLACPSQDGDRRRCSTPPTATCARSRTSRPT